MGKSYTFKQQIEGFPWVQLGVLAVVRFVEPVAFASLFPYVYFMVKSFGIEEHLVARYAGYISGCFALAQCLTGILWGRISDIYGRKPVIIIGILGSAVSLLSFGMSKNIYMAMAARSIAGLLNGNVGVIRTLLGEIATERRHQALAFSIMPLLWQVGCVIGPIVGGYLADPAHTHPEWFKDSLVKDFFTEYPYLLPNIVVSVQLIIGALFAYLFLDETLVDKKQSYDVGRAIGRKLEAMFGFSRAEKIEMNDDEESALLNSRRKKSGLSDSQTLLINHVNSESEQVDTSWKAVLIPPVFRLLFVNSFIALHSVVYDELLPVFLSSRTEKEPPLGPSRFPFHLVGGLGLDSEEVGSLLSVTGFVGIAMLILVFPWVERVYGIMTPFRISMAGFPVIYLLVPFMVLLVDLPSSVVYILVTINLSFRAVFNSLGPPSILVLVNRAAAHPKHLGVVNGTVQVGSAVARAIGPILWGYLMAAGQEIGHAELPWFALAGFAALAYLQSRSVEDKEEDDDEE